MRRRLAVIFGIMVTFPAPAVAQAAADPLRTVELGSGTTTIIVLHGGPAIPHAYLRPEWDRLAPEFRLVYYDQRGCGMALEADPPYGWEQHVTDLHRLVQAYATNGPVVLAGSSWGSLLALLYAQEHPTAAALVLSGTPPWPVAETRATDSVMPPGRSSAAFDSAPPQVQARWKDLLRAQAGYQEAIGAWRQARLDSTEQGLRPREILDGDATRAVARSVAPKLAARFRMRCADVANAVYSSLQRRGPPPTSLRRVTTPALFLRGTRQDAAGDGTAVLADALPNSRVVTLAGAGHDPWFEQPQAFFAHVRRFLARFNAGR